MTVQLPPSTPPALAQTLAEAALQRQSALLAPIREGGAEPAAPAFAALPATPASPAPTPIPQGGAAVPAPPAEADQVSVSPQARAQLAADAAQQAARQSLGGTPS